MQHTVFKLFTFKYSIIDVCEYSINQLMYISCLSMRLDDRTVIDITGHCLIKHKRFHTTLWQRLSLLESFDP